MPFSFLILSAKKHSRTPQKRCNNDEDQQPQLFFLHLLEEYPRVRTPRVDFSSSCRLRRRQHKKKMMEKRRTLPPIPAPMPMAAPTPSSSFFRFFIFVRKERPKKKKRTQFFFMESQNTIFSKSSSRFFD